MEEKKGEVVLYYVVHGFRGALGEDFKKELEKADVVDLEAAAGMPPDQAEIYARIAAGDKDAHRVIVEAAKETFKKTKDPRVLFDIDVANALLGSGKKIVFERQAVKEMEIPKKFTPETMEKMLKDLVACTGVRSIADCRRIVPSFGRNPGQRRLVVRGVQHYITAGFLKAMLERRGLPAPVREIFPPAKRSAMGTPYHVPPELVTEMRAKLGRKVTEENIKRIGLSALLSMHLCSKGWKTNEITPQVGNLANALSVSSDELLRLTEKPHEIRSFFLNKGVDVEKPWWRHEEDALKKMMERMKKQRLQRLR